MRKKSINMDLTLFKKLPCDVKHIVKEMCTEEVYYIDEVKKYSFDDIHELLNIIITGDDYGESCIDHQYNLLKMFQHIVKDLGYFDKERNNTETKGLNGYDNIVTLQWKNRFDEKYWYVNDYYVNDNGDWIYNRIGLPNQYHIDCIRLRQDFINTLNIFDIWFQSNYHGTNIMHATLLSEINKIYKYIIMHNEIYN